MEKESKKRELFNHNYGEENEEEKIEKFFAIIRSMGEIRASLMINGSDVPTLNKETADATGKKRKVEDSDKTRGQVGGWKPTFRREDFVSEYDVDKTQGTVGGVRKPTFRREDCVSEPSHVQQLETAPMIFFDVAPRNEAPVKEVIEEGLNLKLSL